MSQRDTSKSPVFLPPETREQIDAEWLAMLSQTQLFPMKISERTKYNERNCPRPFPKLVDLFDAKNLENYEPYQDQEEINTNISKPISTLQDTNALATGTNVKSRIHEQFSKNPISSDFKQNPSNITRTRSSGYGLSNRTSFPTSKTTRVRPFSAPSSRSSVTRTNVPSHFISKVDKTPSSSSERLRTVQISRVDLQNYLDDRALTNLNVPSERSGSSEGQKSPSGSPSQDLCRRRSSYTVQSEGVYYKYSGNNDSSGDLIERGMELLAKGKDIIESSSKTGHIETQTLQEVVETLNDLVHVELKSLKDENLALRQTNDMLQQQLLTVAKSIESYPIDLTKHPTGSSTQSPPVLEESKNLSNRELSHRISTLEKTVEYLLKSHSTQTSKLQDRIFVQEVRYEETLEKFEDVIGNMTTMFAGLQETYNLQTNRKGISKSAKEFKEILLSIAKASSPSKKVQFKGILKP